MKSQFGKKVPCPHCKTPIHLKDAGILKALNDAEKALDNILKS